MEEQELFVFELEDKDIYTEEGITSQLDDEGIDSVEEGFMIGWLAA